VKVLVDTPMLSFMSPGTADRFFPINKTGVKVVVKIFQIRYYSLLAPKTMIREEQAQRRK